MNYYSSLFAILACTSVVRSQTPGFNPFITPRYDQDVVAGTNFDIAWTPANVPPGASVTIKLLMGRNYNTLYEGPEVAKSIPANAGRFTWPVSRSILDYDTYVLRMMVDGNPGLVSFSPPFELENLDNDDDYRPAGPPPPPASPAPAPVAPGAPIPGRPSHHHDDDDDDDDRFDADSAHDYHDDGPKNPAMSPSGNTPQAGGSVPSTQPPAQGPGSNTSNGTPVDSSSQNKEQASAASPDVSKGTAAAASNDQSNPVTASEATSLAINSLALIGGIAIMLTL